MLQKIIVAFCFAGISALPGWAQEKDSDALPASGFFQSPEEHDQFWTTLKSSDDPEVQAMLPMIYDITSGRPIGTSGQWGKRESPMMGMLADPNVRKELEIVDQQYEELKARNESMRQDVSAQLRAIDFSDQAALTTGIKRIRDGSRDELDNVLLPHQIERLRQLVAQSRLRRQSLVDVLTSEPLKSDLEISDEQEQELRRAESEIEAELEEEIARLRAKARQRLLSRLDRGQQDQVNELFGDAFEFSRSRTNSDKR